VEASTAEEAKRGAVEVFHGFCDFQEIEHAPRERMEVPTAIGHLDTGRAVRIVEMINDQVLVEDLADVDCDMATNYDTYLTFDDERTPRDFDDRGEDPDAYTVYMTMPAAVLVCLQLLIRAKIYIREHFKC